MTRENAAESLPLAPELAAMMKEEVDRTKNQKLPVNRAFEVIAKKSGLKFNTVRNYYYRYIHEKDNKNQQKSNSKNLRKNRRDQGVAGNSFKESEVRYLIMAMLQAQAQGESVRSCANRLANDDPKLMLRYQNKYRNIIANKQEYVKALMEEMDRKGIKYYDPFRKIYVNNATTQNDKEDDGISYVDSDSSKEELLGVIGQLITNMREIDGQSLEHFFKGLRDLSRMAVQWKKQQDDLNTAEDSSNKHREMLKRKRFPNTGTQYSNCLNMKCD
jgi:hypothetical protein